MVAQPPTRRWAPSRSRTAVSWILRWEENATIDRRHPRGICTMDLGSDSDLGFRGSGHRKPGEYGVVRRGDQVSGWPEEWVATDSSSKLLHVAMPLPALLLVVTVLAASVHVSLVDDVLVYFQAHFRSQSCW